MSVKLLTEQCSEFPSLKGGYTDSSESTLIKIPQCWKSHVAAHISGKFGIVLMVTIVPDMHVIYMNMQ